MNNGYMNSSQFRMLKEDSFHTHSLSLLLSLSEFFQFAAAAVL